jgi:hypothetical protein
MGFTTQKFKYELEKLANVEYSITLVREGADGRTAA